MVKMNEYIENGRPSKKNISAKTAESGIVSPWLHLKAGCIGVHLP